MALARKMQYTAIEMLGCVTYPAVPPDAWWRRKEQQGIVPAGIANIWYHRYNAIRRFDAWMEEDEEVWKEHGLTKPTDD